MLVGMFVVMVRYDWVLACVALVVSPPLYLAIRWLNARIHGYATAAREAESELYSRAETAIGAVKLVQAYGREDRVVQDFRAGSERSLALSLRLYGTETLFVLVVESLLAAGTAAIVFLGALQVQGGPDDQALTVFLSYLRDSTSRLSLSQNAPRSAPPTQTSIASFGVDTGSTSGPSAVSLPPVTGEIRFRT
jgi:ABC-type multidrug transport system fused ATPase/permease subunit